MAVAVQERASEEVRRWRDEERRQSQERERRRQREEMDKMRDDVYRYVDARINSLPPPPQPSPLPPPARQPDRHERDQRAERLRVADDARWVERSVEQLVDELTAERERERAKLAPPQSFVERGNRDGARGRTIATKAAHAGYRTHGAGVADTAAPLSVRQRAAQYGAQRSTRAGIGR